MVMEANDPGKDTPETADVSIQETQRQIDEAMERLEQRPAPGTPLFPHSR